MNYYTLIPMFTWQSHQYFKTQFKTSTIWCEMMLSLRGILRRSQSLLKRRGIEPPCKSVKNVLAIKKISDCWMFVWTFCSMNGSRSLQVKNSLVKLFNLFYFFLKEGKGKHNCKIIPYKQAKYILTKHGMLITWTWFMQCNAMMT